MSSLYTSSFRSPASVATCTRLKCRDVKLNGDNIDMEDQIVRLVEVKDALFSTFNQIEDYLTENIPVDANPDIPEHGAGGDGLTSVQYQKTLSPYSWRGASEENQTKGEGGIAMKAGGLC
jgi:hypothetical protein